MQVLFETNVPDYQCRRGKVRDIYDLGDKIIIITTDRVSAFDVVMPTPIPYKGRTLTGLTNFWLTESTVVSAGLQHHLISTDLKQFPPAFQELEFIHRSMLCWKMDEVFPVECIVRGYLTGSAWQSYQETGQICGIKLPAGLKEYDILPWPIFTPSTKAECGHDVNIDFDETCSVVGTRTAAGLRDWSLMSYQLAHELAKKRGIIIVDTKFEFGVRKGQIYLIDEVLTPDSSRFWSVEDYQPGKKPLNFDKQGLRDWLQALCDDGKWDKNPPGPQLPQDIIQETMNRYLEIHYRITGRGVPG